MERFRCIIIISNCAFADDLGKKKLKDEVKKESKNVKDEDATNDDEGSDVAMEDDQDDVHVIMEDENDDDIQPTKDVDEDSMTDGRRLMLVIKCSFIVNFRRQCTTNKRYLQQRDNDKRRYCN